MNLLFWKKKKKTNLFFPKAAALQEEGKCTACERVLTDITLLAMQVLDKLSWTPGYIDLFDNLGLCQECQDRYFGKRTPGQ